MCILVGILVGSAIETTVQSSWLNAGDFVGTVVQRTHTSRVLLGGFPFPFSAKHVSFRILNRLEPALRYPDLPGVLEP